jgi:aminoglycoside phosphotransferase (APT) family kinase protein
MRFTNLELLEKMLLAMQNGIIPALPPSGSLQVALGTVMSGLDELLKRETVTQSYMQTLLPDGLAIAAQQIALLEKIGKADLTSAKAAHQKIADYIPEWNNVAGLVKKYNDLMDHLETCSRLLFDAKPSATAADKKQAADLLKRTAIWEMSFYDQQNQPLPASTAEDLPTSTLEADALAAFIRKQLPNANSVEVENVERVLGGYGKETWLFDLILNGETQPLVVRKNSFGAISLERGTWQIKQEFPMVKILFDEGVRVPEPLWMSTDEPGINTPFYIARRVPGKAMGTFMQSNAGLTEALWLQVAEQLAKIHTIPLAKFAAYNKEFYGDEMLHITAEQGTLNYLNWWYGYWQDFERLSSPLEIYMFDWLYANLPKNTRPASLLHSDFGAHNMLADGDRLTAILDWESPLFGSPAMDLAYVQRWVTEAMDWEKFINHYVASGGPVIDPAEYAFYNAFTYIRTGSGVNKAVAVMREKPTTEYKEIVLGLLFLPKMLQMALINTL